MEMTTLTMQDEKQIKIMQRVFQGEVTGQVEISPSDVVAGRIQEYCTFLLSAAQSNYSEIAFLNDSRIICTNESKLSLM
jgi:hypothetical protein